MVFGKLQMVSRRCRWSQEIGRRSKEGVIFLSGGLGKVLDVLEKVSDVFRNISNGLRNIPLITTRCQMVQGRCQMVL